MATEPQNTATLEPQIESVEPEDAGYDHEAALNAAQQFLDSKADPVESTPAPKRDEKGRFVGKPQNSAPSETVESQPAPPPSNTTGLDPVWVEAAKAEGLSDAAIASLRTPEDIQSALQERRELEAFRQWRQQQWQNPPSAAQQTQAQPQNQTVPAPEDFKLNIDESEFSPEVVAQFKGMADYVNKLKASLPDASALKAEVEALKGALQQQSAVQSQAQELVEQAKFWDSVIPKVPGYVEHFGKATDLLSNNDPERSREVQVFNALYFEPAWNKYTMLADTNPKKLELALRDAWNAYPLAKAGGRNGTNGKQNGALGNGSVVRPVNPRTPVGEAPLPDSGDLGTELDRIMNHASQVWDNVNGNPFKHSGSPLA